MSARTTLLVGLALLVLLALAPVNLSDSGVSGDGSLRGEIAAAHNGDTIDFKAGLHGTIALMHGELLIDQGVTINGPGANHLTVSHQVGE